MLYLLALFNFKLADALFGIDGQLQEYNKNFMKNLPVTLFMNDTLNASQVEEIREFYFKQNKLLKSSNRQDYSNLFTDSCFAYGAKQSINYHLKNILAPVYFYLFGYKGSFSFTPLFGDNVNKYGVCHADELQYIFPVSEILFPDIKITEDDVKVRTALTKLWTNFAKYKNPTPHKVWNEAKWEAVKSENAEYYYIGGGEGMKMDENMYPERIQFWEKLMNKIENNVKTEL